VTASGARIWVYFYQIIGRLRDMGLGGAGSLTLKEARERADEARRLVQQGIDPIADRERRRAEQRLAEASAMTFEHAAEAYIDAMAPGWRNAKHAGQWRSTLAIYAHPTMGSLPISGIDTALVVRCLEAIWTTKPETASRVRGRIEAVLDYA
jgi:hypothetical protein